MKPFSGRPPTLRPGCDASGCSLFSVTLLTRVERVLASRWLSFAVEDERTLTFLLGSSRDVPLTADCSHPDQIEACHGLLCPRNPHVFTCVMCFDKVLRPACVQTQQDSREKLGLFSLVLRRIPTRPSPLVQEDVCCFFALSQVTPPASPQHLRPMTAPPFLLVPPPSSSFPRSQLGRSRCGDFLTFGTPPPPPVFTLRHDSPRSS